MSTSATKKGPEILNELDWGDLLLEIQTEPNDHITPLHGLLYSALYGLLQVSASNWLANRNLGQAEDGALVAIGIDKIFQDIGKFEIPNDDSIGISKAFKSWVVRCCEREWSKHSDLHRERATDPLKIQELREQQLDSPHSLDGDTTSAKFTEPTRSETERILMRKILDEELNKLPVSMKEAIWETEDLKDIENPKARGKQGEAASIANKYSYTPGAIRTCRSRLLKKVQKRYGQENIS